MGAEIVKVLLVVHFHNITNDFPVIALHAFQADPIGLYIFTAAAAVKHPGIGCTCVTDINVPFWETPCSAFPGQPEESTVSSAILSGLPQLFYIVLKICLKEICVMLHDFLQGGNHVHICKGGIGTKCITLRF